MRRASEAAVLADDSSNNELNHTFLVHRNWIVRVAFLCACSGGGRLGGFALKIAHRRLLLQVLAPIEAGIARADLAERALNLAEARLRGRFGDPPSPPHARTRLAPASTLLSATPSAQPATLLGPRKQPCTHKAANRHTHARARHARVRARARTHAQPRHNTPATYSCSDALALAAHSAAGKRPGAAAGMFVAGTDAEDNAERIEFSRAPSAHRMRERAGRPKACRRAIDRSPWLRARQCCA